MPMTDEEKDELVTRLVNLRYRRGPSMSATTSTPPIQAFIRPVGSRGNPAPSTKELIREGKARRECDANVTVPTQPWDRRPDESAKAYEAFTLYRDDGPERTFQDTARQLNKGMSMINLWKRTYQWAARVRAYDEWLEKRERKITERARKEMVERQARLGTTMTDMAQRSIDSGLVVPESVADVVRLAEAGTRIERLARGESTENVRSNMSVILAHPLPPWAPEAAKLLVQENEFDVNIDPQGNIEVPDAD